MDKILKLKVSVALLALTGVAHGQLTITDLTELSATPASGDFVPIVDVSDTTQAASGTTKKIQWSNISLWQASGDADVLLIDANGSMTRFNASSNTDDARGVILATVVNDTAGNGDTVIVAAKTYHLAESLDPPADDFTLQGRGLGTKLVADYSGATAGAVIAAGLSGSGYTGTTNLVIKDLTIEIPSDMFNGVGIAHADGVLLENLHISQATPSGGNNYHAIDLSGCKDVIIRGIVTDHAVDYAIIQLDVCLAGSLAGWDGSAEIALNTDGTPCDGVIIADCHFYSSVNNSAAVHLHRAGAHKDIAISNVINEGGIQFFKHDEISGLENLTITNCSHRPSAAISNALGIGIIGGSGGTVQGVVISNYVQQGGREAVILRDVEGALLSNIYHKTAIADARPIVIGEISAAAGGNHVLSNLYFENTGTSIAEAIDVEANVDQVRISGLHVENYSKGVTANGSNVSVSNATFSGVASNIVGAGVVPAVAWNGLGIGTDTTTELLHLASAGPARIRIEADTNDATETDTAAIILSQDGGSNAGGMGFVGNTNEDWTGGTMTGAVGNDLLIAQSNNSSGVTFGVGTNVRGRFNSSGLTVVGLIEGRSILRMVDATYSGTPATGNAAMWADSGEMKVKDDAGNVTTISPHPSGVMEVTGVTGAAKTLGMDYTVPKTGLAVAQPKARWLEWYVEINHSTGEWTKRNFSGEKIDAGQSNKLIE